MLELTPELSNSTSKPIYTQLYEYIKAIILNEDVQSGERLPSIRYLAKHLNISKNTVITAYEQLLAEGYVSSRGTSGLFIEKLHKDILKNSSKEFIKEEVIQVNNNIHASSFDFRNAQIDINSFPYTIWRKVLNQCINLEMSDLLNYGEHQGEMELRTQISHYLLLSRGVKCTPQQILIGAGTQQSLTMLSLILKNIGTTIAFEEPGYNGARKVFIDNNFIVHPIELESDGINIKALAACAAQIVYITPSHQFPYGMVMPINKRLMLLQWAKERNGFIIEDDYDGEFRYQGNPIPSLQALDTNGNVIYLGTFSKSLIPSVRISYLVLPEKLLQIYKKNYSIYEQPVCRLNQKALQLFMEQGFWNRHIKKVRNIYKKKHDLLITSINDILGDKVEIIGKDAGLHILLRVNNGMKEVELINAAYLVQVCVSPVSPYWFNKRNADASVVFIGFAGIKLEAIPQGIAQLKKCWFL